MEGGWGGRDGPPMGGPGGGPMVGPGGGPPLDPTKEFSMHRLQMARPYERDRAGMIPGQRVHPPLLNSWLSQATTRDELMDLFAVHGQWFDKVHYANLWNKLGRHLRKHHGRADWLQINVSRMEELLIATTEYTPQCDARGIANIAHGAVFARGPNAKLLYDSLIRAAMAKLSEFNPQNLANTVWAFAQSGNRAPELFAAVSKVAQSKLHMMNPQELANTAWAYATAQEVAPALFNAIEQAVPRKLSEFNAQNLADSAWAFARTGRGEKPFFDAVARGAHYRLAEFKVQELATCLWALATAQGAVAPALFEAAMPMLLARLGDLNMEKIHYTCIAYARGGHRAPELFKGLCHTTTDRVEQFSPRELSEILWSFAAVGEHALELFESTAESLKRRMALSTYDFTAPIIAKMLWAFAAANYAKGSAIPLFTLCVETLSQLDPKFDRLPEGEELTQLHQWEVWVRDEIGHEKLALPEAMSADALRAMAEFYRGLPAKQLKAELVLVLDAMGVAYAADHVTEHGYTLDAALVEDRIGIDIQGKKRLLQAGKEGKHTPTGAANLKRRQLEAFGWRYLAVPHWEWVPLEGIEAQTEYLKAAIDEVRKREARAPPIGGGGAAEVRSSQEAAEAATAKAEVEVAGEPQPKRAKTVEGAAPEPSAA